MYPPPAAGPPPQRTPPAPTVPPRGRDRDPNAGPRPPGDKPDPQAPAKAKPADPDVVVKANRVWARILMRPSDARCGRRGQGGGGHRRRQGRDPGGPPPGRGRLPPGRRPRQGPRDRRHRRGGRPDQPGRRQVEIQGLQRRSLRRQAASGRRRPARDPVRQGRDRGVHHRRAGHRPRPEGRPGLGRRRGHAHADGRARPADRQGADPRHDGPREGEGQGEGRGGRGQGRGQEGPHEDHLEEGHEVLRPGHRPEGEARGPGRLLRQRPRRARDRRPARLRDR